MARDTLSALIVLAAVLAAMFAPLIKDAAHAMASSATHQEAAR